MLQSQETTDVDELLAKATQPAAAAIKLHPFYRGKIETALKCCIRDIDDFAIWYTPGVAALCRDIEAPRPLRFPQPGQQLLGLPRHLPGGARCAGLYHRLNRAYFERIAAIEFACDR